MQHNIQFLPSNKKVPMDEGHTILEAALDAGVLIDGSCAGKGTCGACKVIVMDGLSAESISPEEERVFSKEELEAGYRLACQRKVYSDLTVMIPDLHGSSNRKKKMNSLPKDFSPDIFTEKSFIKIPKAKLDFQVNTLDRIRLETGLSDLKIKSSALSNIQRASVEKRGKVTLVIQDHTLIALEPGDTTDVMYGIALDIGTTTIVAMLWNLCDGTLVDVEAGTNPQSVFGADVISRIQYCLEGETLGEDHLSQIQGKVIECVNDMIGIFSQRNGIERENIYELTMVGNTTMSHLFLGVNPVSMSRVPFAPVYCEGIHIDAGELGIKVNPAASLYVLPNIAGHVGSDITAVMIATDLFHLPGNTIAIDIGTNGEILAASDGEVKACSTAAGPAFEGASIQCGMRAAKGAIEKVSIGETVVLTTIENVDPVGICGSGLIDVIGEMVRVGLINENGNILTKEEALAAGIPKAVAHRLRGENAAKEFVLVYKNEENAGTDAGKKEEGVSGQNGICHADIVLTQKDVREVQLAKGAILAGMLTLMKKLKFTMEELDRVIIAGAFGSYINKESAVRMGLLPKIAADKIQSIGNGAGTGSAMALLSEKIREKAEEESRKIEHVELSHDMDFEEYYIDSMLF